MRVAIIGTGNIGTDLLVKLLKIPKFEIVGFVGRRQLSKWIPPGVKYFETGIDFFIKSPRCCDLVFDCTDAASASEHARVFLEQDIFVVDMTPSKVGRLCVPSLNLVSLENVKNVNMITCGGQASIPLIKYVSSRSVVSYVEVVTQISSESAGMATRVNVDKYIETTENAINTLGGVPTCKVILNVNPDPRTVMQTTLLFRTSEAVFEDFDDFVRTMRSYIPHYEVVGAPVRTNGILMVSIRILGSGDHLSVYAGNLDIINCAAIEVARQFSRLTRVKKQSNDYDRMIDI